jgi:Ca2+-binding RTX toxin-like protein
MAFELHVVHSLDARTEELLLVAVGRIERAIRNLRKDEKIMNTKLQGVVTGLAPRLQSIDTVLASVQTFISTGVNQIVAAAVAKALADNNVDEDAAADTVDAAVADVEHHLQPLMDAIKAGTSDQNTPTPITPEPVPPEVTGGTDTQTDAGGEASTPAGGAGDDSVQGGTGTDTITGGEASTPQAGAGDDSLQGGQGSDSIQGGTGDDSQNG